jgi:DNA/RNA endonuclease G (NUC1)
VKYTEIQPGVFNLGFGDWDEVEQEVRDNARTDNADRDIVLATVASTVIDFIQYHPDVILYAEGEIPSEN